MGCIFGLLDYLMIRSWIWIFWWFVGTMKYSLMWIVAIIMGPRKTIHKLAASNASRISGVPAEVVAQVLPALYAAERAKVIAWFTWTAVYWIATAYMMYVGSTNAGLQ